MRIHHIAFLIVVTPALALPTKSVRTPFDWTLSEDLTAKQTIARETKLSKPERTALARALSLQLKDFHTDEKDLVSITRVKAVDLNSDGTPEIIAQASGDICSPTGNCPFWVFQKTASGYKVILKRGAVQDFAVQKTSSQQYFDIVVGMHGSATEQDLRLYRFRDGKYRTVGCYNANWSYIHRQEGRNS